MAPIHDWKTLVIEQARASGAPDLAPHTIEELAAHLEDIYLDAIRAGRSDAEAYRAAIIALSESALRTVPRSRTRGPESRPVNEVPAGRGLNGLAGDLKSAWRQWRRSPSFAAIAIITLGLGAGAATAIFSIVDTVLLRPLPFHEPQSLVTIWEGNPEKGLPKERLSPVNFMDYRGVQAAFVDAAAWWRPEINLSEPGMEPVRVNAVETSGNLFQLLGVSAAHGPGFPQDGPFFSRDQIAVISDRLWRERYNSDPNILGRVLSVNAGQYRIAGVMPPGFHYPDGVDVWLRLQWDLTRHSRGAHFMEAVARLKPGVSDEQASRELAQLSGRLGEENPQTNGGWLARSVPLLEDMLGYYRPALFVLLGAVALVLITACLNVAGLLLARATARGREMAVRAALGASRLRLIRQVLVESLLLAAAGTIVGAAGAVGLLRAAIAAFPATVPRLSQATLDLRLLAFALGTAALTTLLFGMLPAIVSASTDASEALKDGTRTSTGVRGRRLSRALVVLEIALACAVLVASALLVRSVTRMMQAPTGVIPDGVVTATVQLSSASDQDWNAVEQFYAALLASARQQPGVLSVGAANAIPLEIGWRIPFGVEGRPPARTDEDAIAQHVTVSSGYFEALRARLVAGRFFADTDSTAAEPVVMVNETFAKRVFPEGDALGKRIMSLAQQVGPLGRNLSGRARSLSHRRHRRRCAPGPSRPAWRARALSLAAPVSVPCDDARRTRAGHCDRRPGSARRPACAESVAPARHDQDHGRTAGRGHRGATTVDRCPDHVRGAHRAARRDRRLRTAGVDGQRTTAGARDPSGPRRPAGHARLDRHRPGHVTRHHRDRPRSRRRPARARSAAAGALRDTNDRRILDGRRRSRTHDSRRNRLPRPGPPRDPRRAHGRASERITAIGTRGSGSRGARAGLGDRGLGDRDWG